MTSHTCMCVMASCSCSSWWAELRASRRMSVSLRSFSQSSERNSDTSFSSVPSRSSHDLTETPTDVTSHTRDSYRQIKQTLTLLWRFSRGRYSHHDGFWVKKGRSRWAWRSPRCQRMMLWSPFYWRPCWRSFSTAGEQRRERETSTVLSLKFLWNQHRHTTTDARLIYIRWLMMWWWAPAKALEMRVSFILSSWTFIWIF